MKRLFLLFLAFPLIGNGQSNSVLSDLMGTSSSENRTLAETQVHGFVQRLKLQNTRSEIVFLRKVFHQTQRTFLNQYDPYSEFNELFTAGKYDCLTATALFSLVLDKLNFKYNIIETNYHIFVMVNTSKGEVLLETTDRFNGFVRNAKEIQERIGTYRQGVTAGTTANRQIYRYHFDLYHTVSPNQLPGLLYYNLAVKAYNEGSLEKCAELLVKAKAVYDSPRIGEFSLIFLRSVAASKMDDQTKQRILVQFKNLRPPVLASR